MLLIATDSDSIANYMIDLMWHSIQWIAESKQTIQRDD